MLEWELTNNTVRAWLTAGGIFAVLLLLLLVLRAVLQRRVAIPVVANVLRQTRVFFLVALALLVASQYLVLTTGWEHTVRLLVTLASVLQVALWGNGLIAFSVARYASRRAISGDAQSPTTLAVLGVIARVVMWLILILIALDNLGVHITTLVAGLGISGVAVALAVQNILGDLFGALSIVLDKPFIVGDAITVDTFTGIVEHIGLKTTRLRSVTGEQLIFANSDLLKSRIRNWKRMSERAVTMVTRLSYQNPPHMIAGVPALISDVVAGVPQTRLARSHVRALGDAGVEVETLYFVLSADYGAYMTAQQAVTLGTLTRLADEGVAIPTPINTVLLRADVTTAVSPGPPPSPPPRTTPSPRA